METLNNMLLAVPKMATDDYVGFTFFVGCMACLLYTSPSPRDAHESRMPSSA